MSFDNDVVVLRWQNKSGNVLKKHAIRWIYFSYFNKINYEKIPFYDLKRYLEEHVSNQKPHTQLSIVKWVVENILSI